MTNLIVNHGGLLPKEYRGEDHGINEQTGLPKLFRAILLGASGSGKSNLLIDFIKRSPNVYTHLHLVARQPEQPLYQWLKDQLNGFITLYGEDNPPLVDNIKRDGLQLVVFDDFSNDKKFMETYMTPFFIRGRHKGLTTIHLAHAFYTGCPKMVRLNCEVLMILKVPSRRDLQMVLRDVPIGGVDDDMLWSFYTQTSKNKGQMMLMNTLDQTIRYNWHDILHDGLKKED